MEAYTIKDIIVLMNVLMIRHMLSCTLHKLKQGKYHIYIKNKSMPLLLEGIRPFINLWGAPFKNFEYPVRTFSGLPSMPKRYFATSTVAPTPAETKIINS